MEVRLARPRISVVKRQREQAKRDRKAEKAQRREERKNQPAESEFETEVVAERPITPSE